MRVRSEIAFCIVMLLCAAAETGFARERGLYRPLEVRRAYELKTRSVDGRPGARYWRNRAEYSIAARIDTAARAVAGFVDAVYYNDSPDTLNQLIVRLAPEDRGAGGATVSRIAIDGRDLASPRDFTRRGTIIAAKLDHPLKPGASLKLSIAWRFVPPDGSPELRGSPEGAMLFASQWYPRIAVYDDIYGWDRRELHGASARLGDFSDFDVRIAAPGGFVVWATGELLNPRETLSAGTFARYTKALASDKIVSIVSAKDRASGGVTASGDTIRWHFAARSVPDFAFGASDRCLWDMTSFAAGGKTGGRIASSSAYRGASRSFRQAAAICRGTIESLSSELPGAPFPFQSVTVVEGPADAAFPMMISVQAADGWLFHQTLSREIVRSFFPHLVGVGDRACGSLEDGLARMIPMVYQTREISRFDKTYDAAAKNCASYERIAGGGMEDRPPALPLADGEGSDSHADRGSRPAEALRFLEEALGEDAFKTALREFMDRWRHRHPTLYDFCNTFENVIGENLSWFWKPWFFEPGYPDLALKETRMSGGERIIYVEKRGSIPVPVKILVRFVDGTTANFYQTARAWDKGNDMFSISVEGTTAIRSIELGDAAIPDVDRSNNVLRPR
jgi:hypothetical protein